jgi:hypothetical protein
MKEGLMKSSIWSVAVCGSETRTIGKNEEMVCKCILNMVLERNDKNKMDRYNNE